MISQKKLSNTQALLTYVAMTCGSWDEVVRASELGGEKPSIWKMAKIAKNWADRIKLKGGSFDAIHTQLTDADIAFVRGALKGGRYGNYHNGLIEGIFGYCANI